MNELASLMLQLDVADVGEPSFTLASPRTPQGHVSETHAMISEASLDDDEITLSREDCQQLLECFSSDFNHFHQFLSPGEVENWSLKELRPQEVDLEFRNCALLAVAASCSAQQRFSDLWEHFSKRAKSLVFRSIREQASDLVVQGLALLAWIELKTGSDSMAYNWIGEYHVIVKKSTDIVVSYGHWTSSASRITCKCCQVDTGEGDPRSSSISSPNQILLGLLLRRSVSPGQIFE